MTTADKVRMLRDRDWWRELGTAVGWRLFGFSYRNEATFFTDPVRNNPRIEVTGSQRDQIMSAIKTARKGREG